MVAIRNINANAPYVFRYPEWRENVFYPVGSLVSYTSVSPFDSDYGFPNYYVTIRDVAASNNTPPNANSDFVIIFSGEAAALDSEQTNEILNIDSDVKQAVHDYLSNDSDFNIVIAQAVEDYMAKDSEHDSEINVIERRLNDIDSDLNITEIRITDNDSDIGVLQANIGFLTARVADYGSF
jgi:hypothetical protein